MIYNDTPARTVRRNYEGSGRGCPEIIAYLGDYSQDNDCVGDRPNESTEHLVHITDRPVGFAWLGGDMELYDDGDSIGEYGLSDDDLESLTIHSMEDLEPLAESITDLLPWRRDPRI